MMEVSGMVLTGVSMVGTVTACLDLLEDIIDGRRVSKDIDSFVRQVGWVRIQFIAWCNQSGMWDLVNSIQSDTEKARPIQAPTDVNVVNRTQSTQTLVQKCLEDTIKALFDYLQESRKFLDSYGAVGAPRQRNVLRKRRPAEFMAYASQVTQQAEEKPRENGKWDMTKWGTVGYRESKRLLEELKACIEALQGLLEMTNPQAASSVMRISQTIATNTAFGNAVAQEAASHNQSQYPADQTLVSLSQISGRQRQISQLQDSSQAAIQQPMQSLSIGDGGLIRLRSNDFSLSVDKDNPSPEREITTHNGQQVIVEWRYFSSRLSAAEKELLEHRIALLVHQLRQAATVSDFRVLKCLGFFYSEKASRYGIVFEVPNTIEPMTLGDILANRAIKHRFLDARLRLARQLVTSVFRFFSVGWLHKNIRSSSVLFIQSTSDTQNLPDAFLGGFGFARMESATANTELNPSRFNDVQKSRNWRLHCHPDRYKALMIEKNSDAAASALSNMRYDAYGLGIMLIEIALWLPVTSLCSSKETVEDFQKTVVQKTATAVRCAMGEKYADIVRRLLKSDFGQKIERGTEFSDSRLMFLAAFEKTVVVEMERLNC